MMKSLIKILISVLMLFTSLQIFAQDKSIAFGIGGGITQGINEANSDQLSFGPLFNLYGLYQNGLGKNFTPELSLSYYVNGTSNFGGFNQYKTSYIIPEIRLRYYFPVDWLAKPYIFTGIGAMFYNVQNSPFNTDPKAELNSTTYSIPLGLGLTYTFYPKWALDFNIYYNFSGTDNLNPVWDNSNDGSIVTRLGIHYTIYEVPNDADGDGLSDVDEAKYGTDPNNPDTDNDGLTDGEEIHEYKTDPKKADTDNGGINDGIEVKNGANPLDPDDDILSIPVGGNLITKNIEFDTGKATLTSSSDKTLNNVLKAMKAAPDMELRVTGHTDDTGDRDMNIKLSQERAETVKAWLVARGISPNRITTRGAGPDEPLVPNTSDENRQKNRRVEFSRGK